MSEEDKVRKASEQFYAALNGMLQGDAGSLADIWSHGKDVSAMHPIGKRDIGWDEVRNSFEQVAVVSSGGKVELTDRIIHVIGDVGYELGIEHGQATFGDQNVSLEQRVTNIYRKETGGWRIVHHHVDFSPAMSDVLRQLKAKV